MNIHVQGRKLDLGDAFTAHAKERLHNGIEKYVENPIDAQILVLKDGHEFLSDVSLNLSTGLHAQARGRAGDIYASLESALERLEKQLRRYKRKLKNYNNTREQIEFSSEKSYILESFDDDSLDETQDLQPAIIAETEIFVPTLSVGEAVMRMELIGEAMFVFRNASHGGVNVVHVRNDGNIGWIDPRRV